MAQKANTEKEKIKEIARLLNNIAEDMSVPRNVRKNVTEIRSMLLDDKEDLNVRIGNAIYSLEESGEDVNIPMHARTQIWAILSALESIIK